MYSIIHLKDGSMTCVIGICVYIYIAIDLFLSWDVTCFGDLIHASEKMVRVAYIVSSGNNIADFSILFAQVGISVYHIPIAFQRNVT